MPCRCHLVTPNICILQTVRMVQNVPSPTPFSNSFQSSPTTRYSIQLHLSPSLLNHASLNPAIRVFSPNILPLQFLSAPLPPTYTPQFKFLGTATSSILGALSFKSFMI